MHAQIGFVGHHGAALRHSSVRMFAPLALVCVLCLMVVQAQMHTWSKDNIKSTCTLSSGDTMATVQADGTITTVPRPTLAQMIEKYSLWSGLYDPADGDAETVPFMYVKKVALPFLPA